MEGDIRVRAVTDAYPDAGYPAVFMAGLTDYTHSKHACNGGGRIHTAIVRKFGQGFRVNSRWERCIKAIKIILTKIQISKVERYVDKSTNLIYNQNVDVSTKIQEG